jgi:hypothetical protein
MTDTDPAADMRQPVTLTIISDAVPGVVFQLRAVREWDFTADDAQTYNWRGKSGPVQIDAMGGARRTEFHDGPAGALVEGFIDLMIAYGLDGGPTDPDQFDDILTTLRAVVDAADPPTSDEARRWAETAEAQQFMDAEGIDSVQSGYAAWVERQTAPYWFLCGDMQTDVNTWHYVPHGADRMTTCGILSPLADGDEALIFRPDSFAYAPLAVGTAVCPECKVAATDAHQVFKAGTPITVRLGDNPDVNAEYFASRKQ